MITSGSFIRSRKSGSVVSTPVMTISFKRAPQPHQAFGAVAAMDDQLADQRVVVRRDRVAGIDGAVQAHAETARRVIAGDLAWRGAEGCRVLGVDAALDGVAVEFHVLLLHRKLRAIGDADLFAHKINAGDHLRDRMLDLQARVHFDEIEFAVLVEILDGADTEIAKLLESRPP